MDIDEGFSHEYEGKNYKKVKFENWLTSEYDTADFNLKYMV